LGGCVALPGGGEGLVEVVLEIGGGRGHAFNAGTGVAIQARPCSHFAAPGTRAFAQHAEPGTDILAPFGVVCALADMAEGQSCARSDSQACTSSGGVPKWSGWLPTSLSE